MKRYGIKVHTYCLMTTHYHFLIETPHPNLSQAIKWINVGYSVYFNRKRRRFGHLFQGRFKAVLVDADEYLKQLSRYIHLTPGDLIQAVSGEFGCGIESILQKGEKGNLARDLAVYRCRELTGETSVALGRRFDISGTGIAARHDQIAKKLETDRKLKGREDRIRKKIINI